MDNNNEKTLEELQRQSGIMKKKLTVILISVLGAVALILGTATVVSILKNNKKPDFEYDDSYFYPTYQGDIMTYSDYLDLDRTVSYCADPSGQGMTTSIDETNEAEFDASVLFLRDYINVVISGDEQAYNALFNETYYKKNKPQAPFTPQMIYRTKITYRTEETDGDDRLVAYWLEYMIFENDGTFRRDIASNASRRQNVVLRISADGSIRIEELTTVFIQ